MGAALVQQAASWLASLYPGRGIYLLVLEVNAPARRFYERLGARNAGVSTMETHGGAMVRSCRYVWSRPHALVHGTPAPGGRQRPLPGRT